MEVLIILIFISLCIAVCFLIMFFIAVKNNQFDDVYTPSVRILFDNDDEKSITK